MTWTLADIDWQRFDRDAVTPGLLAVVKAAALVEGNADDYVGYLEAVFADDPEFRAAARQWGEEENRHGAALAQWARLADPSYDYASAMRRFHALYRLPQPGDGSVRGSRGGELIARCIVECGTSGLYSALRDGTAEPVLAEICHRIAGDEFRHYKLFLKQQRRFARPSLRERLRIAGGRVLETGDDELAAAWHAANGGEAPYGRRPAAKAFRNGVLPYYRRGHIARMVMMACKAIGMDAQGRSARWLERFAWYALALQRLVGPAYAAVPSPARWRKQATTSS